ncbi:uncharacterized protein LOC130678866 [Manis pentadactyla]|uniref:uncharacterized protein LOC130678866 n=1 Tax=Manis pentadactyla TaxID=143292 RepID=UPI00255CB9F2|nr:uncharacterized protein LOC130678866 [Manis pentadactyla]
MPAIFTSNSAKPATAEEAPGLRLPDSASHSPAVKAFPSDAALPRQSPAPPAGVFRQRLPAVASCRLQEPPSPGSGRRLPHAGLSSQPQLTVRPERRRRKAGSGVCGVPQHGRAASVVGCRVRSGGRRVSVRRADLQGCRRQVSTGNNFVLKSTHESSTWSMSAYICCFLPPGSHEAGRLAKSISPDSFSGEDVADAEAVWVSLVWIIFFCLFMLTGAIDCQLGGPKFSLATGLSLLGQLRPLVACFG